MEKARCISGILFACTLLGVSGCATAPSAGVSRDWGPFYCADRTLGGEARVRAAGPFYEQRADAGRSFAAVRPFYAVDRSAEDDYTTRHFLWPAGVSKEFGQESYWRFLLAFGHDFDNTQDDSRYRFMLFPLIFAGRDKDRHPYFAVFPLGGTIHEFLGRDEVSFVLFPLYSRSSINDLNSLSVLWPIYSRTVGGDVDRFRVFPFYGRSINGDLSDKRFVLWPFWTQAEFNHPKSRGSGYVLFPLYGHIELSDQETWMILPPFFRRSRSETRSEVHAPWPFFQYRSDGDDDKLYLWPLWGRKQSGSVRSWFFLYPLLGGSEADRGGYTQTRWSVFPVCQSEKRIIKPEATGSDRAIEAPDAADSGDEAALTSSLPRRARDRRYFKLWPLFSYRRDGDASRFRLPDLWPLSQTVGVEHNWSPLWTLYTQSRLGGAEEDELLWGVYRHRRQEGTRRVSLFPIFERSRREDGSEVEWSVMKGLAAYRRFGLEYEFRLLYFLRINLQGGHP